MAEPLDLGVAPLDLGVVPLDLGVESLDFLVALVGLGEASPDLADFFSLDLCCKWFTHIT